MITSRDVRSNLQNLLDYLVRADIVLLVNAVTDERTKRITLHSPLSKSVGDLFREPQPTVAEYMEWVRAGAYSAMLLDGSLLQLTFDYDERYLSGYRLAFVPCPFAIDQGLARSEPILDVLELYAEQSSLEVHLRASIRFDFDPRNAASGHAAAHATINSSHCRIPCVSAISLGHFVAFVFQHFYPELWAAHGYLRELPKYISAPRTIQPDEERLIHLAWRSH